MPLTWRQLRGEINLRIPPERLDDPVVTAMPFDDGGWQRYGGLSKASEDSKDEDDYTVKKGEFYLS